MSPVRTAAIITAAEVVSASVLSLIKGENPLHVALLSFGALVALGVFVVNLKLIAK